MSKELEKLKSIGAQKIHEATHISRAHAQAVLHETFDDLNKVQFLGFISILEREYKLNLSELKAKGLAHFKDFSPEDVSINSKVFSPKKKKKTTFIYALLAFIILILLSYFELIPTLGTTTQISESVNNEVIENAQKNIDATTTQVNDLNDTTGVLVISQDTNTLPAQSTETPLVAESPKVDAEQAQAPKVEEVQKAEVVAPKVADTTKVLKIMPKTKVWMGYIDIKENKKYQKLFEGEFSVNPEKDWLLLFGHGYLDIDVNGKVEEFRTAQNLRFKYVDGQLTKITISEFKKINKDSQW